MPASTWLRVSCPTKPGPVFNSCYHKRRPPSPYPLSTTKRVGSTLVWTIEASWCKS